MYKYAFILAIATILFYSPASAFQNQWQAATGMNGITLVQDIEVRGDELLVLGRNNVYYSDNNGNSFINVGSNSPLASIFGRITWLDESNFLVSTLSGELYLGNKFGNRFERVYEDAGFTEVSSFFVRNNNLFLGFANGSIYLSDTELSSFVEVLSPSLEENNGIKNIFHDGVFYYATIGNKVLRTENAGSLWEDFSFTTSPSEAYGMVEYNDTLFIVDLEKIYFSTDRARTWRIFPTPTVMKDDNFIGITTNGTTLLIRGSRASYKFHEGSWSTIQYDKFITGFAEVHPKGLYTAASGVGILYSPEINNNYVILHRGMGEVWVNTFAHSPEGKLYAGTNAGIFVSTNNGSQWSQFAMPGTNVYSVVQQEDTLWVGFDAGFAKIIMGDTLNVLTSPFYTVNHAILHKGVLFFSTGSGLGDPAKVYKVINDTFTESGTGLENMFLTSVRRLASDGSVLYAATNDGFFMSTDDGATWEQQLFSIIPQTTIIQDVVAKDGQICVLLYNGFVLRSTNNGRSWQNISFDLPVEASSYHAINIENDIITVASNSGIYTLLPESIGWTREEFSTPVYSLAQVGSRSLAGTFYGVKYKNTTTSVPEHDTIVATYPNPATTEVRMVSTSTDETWFVTDAVGKKIDIPYNISHSEVIFPLQNIGKGTYLLRSSKGKTAKFYKE